MTVRFGIQLCQQHPAGEAMADRFDELVEQVRLARDLGFSTIVTGQHYLADPLQILQPLPVLARLAAEAGDMRVGTCVQLLGLASPVDAAEEIATLDTIARGRFVVGVALGYRDVEFDAFGVPRDQRLRRFVSNLETVKRLLAGAVVTHDEPHSRLDGQRLTLRPVQRPHPPVWVGANADNAVRRAARIGDAWLINTHGRLGTLARQMAEIYRPELETAGKPFPDVLPLRREIFVAEDRRTALREAAPWLLEKYRTYTAWGQDKALPADDHFHEEAEELIRDRFILGSPEECYEQLRPCWAEVGANFLVLRTHWSGMPLGHALGSMRLISDELLPALRRVTTR